MTHQSPSTSCLSADEAGRQLAQLRQVLELVEQIAGRGGWQQRRDAALDDGARISAAYGDALSIVQRRFNALAAETAAWAASGVEALIGSSPDRPAKAAAARLAEELEDALAVLSRLVRA
jgi:hypothetical protein